MSLFQEDASMNTILGPGSVLQGDLKIQGYARLDGDLKGDFCATGNLIIGSNARVLGNVKAKNAIICGIVEGNVDVAQGVTLQENAVVLGDIRAQHLKVEDTAIIQGHCTKSYAKSSIDEKQSSEKPMKI